MNDNVQMQNDFLELPLEFSFEAKTSFTSKSHSKLDLEDTGHEHITPYNSELFVSI